MKKTTYTTGQQITITLHKPLHSNFPIGRTDTGIIAKLKTDRKYLEYGSVWNANISEVHDKFIVAEPYQHVRTATEDEALKQDKLKTLIRTKEPRKRKEKVNYQYLRNSEK